MPRSSAPGEAVRSRAALALGLGLSLVACSAGTTSYTADADTGSTQALITIERRQVLGSPAQAEAFASFVRTPPDVDPSLVTRVTGLDLGLPDLGECAPAASGRDGSVPLSPLRRVELLDAGEVALETTSGRVDLARRAFPSVTDLLAGVVYTTREKSADLPPASHYSLWVAGSAQLAAFDVRAEAPAALEGLTLDGLPLDTEGLALGKGSVLAWTPGSARDLVYIVLESAELASATLCSFRDSDGRGALLTPALPAGPATLGVHRLRSVPLSGASIGAGELRFDFEQLVTVEVKAGE